MMKLLKKSLSFTIVLAMLITMMPATVWAAVDSTGKPTDLTNDIVLSIYTPEGEFPGEPAVYGTSNYRSFKSDFTLGSTSSWSAVIFKDSAEDELDPSILDKLVEGTHSSTTTVWGAYDANGMKKYFREEASIIQRENEKKMICAIKGVSEIEAENYEIIWYVIKLQHSSGWLGKTEWHIDGVIKETAKISINYYGNGNTSGAAPLGKTNHKTGDSYTVLGQNDMIKKIGGVEVGFLGWSARADGTGAEAGFYQPGDVINPTESISLYAMWDTTTQYTATVNTYLDGVLTSDSSIQKESRELYLSTDKEHYYKLTETSSGVYTVNITGNGKLHLYYKKADGTYTQIGNNQLTIYNQNGSMDVHHYSVSYDANGGAFATAQQSHNYGYGETVTAIKDIPTREGYSFLGWDNGNGNVIQPGEIVTESITAKTVLTAKWEKNVSVTINVTINHEGGGGYDQMATKDDVTVALAKRADSSSPYLETGHVLKLNNEEHNGFSYAPVYGEDNTDAEVKTTQYISKDATYTNLPGGDVEYTVVASKSGYDTAITPTEDANGNWTIEVVMIYNPTNFDLAFTVTVDETVPAQYVPTAAIVKVLSWYADREQWDVITQQEGGKPGVRVDIDTTTRSGSGSYPVWRYQSAARSSTPYGYRAMVSSFVYPDGTIVPASESVTAVSWTDGAYVATMDDVDGGRKYGELNGAYFEESSNAQKGNLNLNIKINLHAVTFDAKGGKVNGLDKQTVTEQLRIPAFADYVPVRDGGYIFAGWYTDEACTVAAVEGTALSGNTTLYAKWIAPLTISGTVSVSGTYQQGGNTVSVHDIDRATEAVVVLQEIRDGKAYEVDSQTINFGDYKDTGSADYAFTGIKNEGKNYQVRVLVLNYTTTYDNEIDEGTSYSDTEYTAVFGSDNVADVDAYLEFKPSAYDQILNVDATAIGEGFRPSNVLSEVMYRDTGDNKPYNCISQHTVPPYGVVIGLTDGIGKDTQAVWQWHTNGQLYLYQMNITVVDGKTYNSDTTPFDIVYDAPAYWNEKTGENSSELKATLVPKIYAVNFDLNANGDTVTGMDAYLQKDGSYLSKHTWSYATPINAVPERANYMFLGWEADVDSAYNGSEISADVAQNVTLIAKWAEFKWVTDTDSGYIEAAKGKESVVRFLFDVATTDELKNGITQTGIKFIKSSNIGERVETSEVAGEALTGSSTTFYGDITNIPESNAETKYYAIAFVVCNGITNWSLPVECGPDFNDLILYK